MQTCSVEDCDSPVFVKVRGLCKMHYHRVMRHGDVGEAAPLRLNGPSSERWKALYEVAANGCWIWIGSVDKYGYGQYGRCQRGNQEELACSPVGVHPTGTPPS